MVRLRENKQASKDKPIEKIPLPKYAYLPLSQHIGKPCQPLVKLGDTVTLGQKIASVDAGAFAPIHASVSGKVFAIRDWPHPTLGRCKAIVIENDGQEKSEIQNPNDSTTLTTIKNLTPNQIRNAVLEAGIVGMGGASFPTHIKLNPPKPVETLIINGAECEPYLTADYRLMLEKTDEILKGVDLVAKCLGVKNVYLAIEDNKPQAIKVFNYRLPITNYQLRILKSYYPQGGEKQLIKNILKKEVPSGKLPFDIGVVVQNVATCLAIYEAVYLDKPLYERVVTITGSCLSNPKNLLVRIGTPIKELIDFCGPLKEEVAKIVIGGPMMGVAQYTDETPVIKSTTGLILLNKKEVGFKEESSCIRCGACIRECPVGLLPCLINLAALKGQWSQVKELGCLDCIECGLCSYVCPANRWLVQSIKMAKVLS